MPPVPAPDADAAAAAEPGNPPPRPRPAEQQRKEDHSYYFAEVARVNAELVLPLLDPGGPPGLVQKQLCWAFLLRTVQTRFYLHSCTTRYCLQNRRSCRFWFPWPQQHEQQFDESTERVAYRRRHPPDDRFVVPHNLCAAAFSPATVNVLLFDPEKGADTARQYATNYVAKPESYTFLEAEAGDEQNPTKRYLETRTVGAPMACNRLMGFHVVRCTKPVEDIRPQLTNEPAGQWVRDAEHMEKNPNYPDPDNYLGPTQKYFFRDKTLRHMRIGQKIRYFADAKPGGAAKGEQSARDTSEDTCNRDRYRPASAEEAEEGHRHYDKYAARHVEPGR